MTDTPLPAGGVLPPLADLEGLARPAAGFFFFKAKGTQAMINDAPDYEPSLKEAVDRYLTLGDSPPDKNERHAIIERIVHWLFVTRLSRPNVSGVQESAGRSHQAFLAGLGIG